MKQVITDQELDYIYKELKRIHRILDKAVAKYNRRGLLDFFRKKKKKKNLINKKIMEYKFLNIYYDIRNKKSNH